MAKVDYERMAQQLDLTPSNVIDKIEDLKMWVCLHTRFASLQQIIMNAIAGGSRDLLIVVIGPARVGKTTLFESIAGMLNALARRKGKKRGCFRFSVPPPDKQGRFNWKAAITEAYRLGEEILPSSKISYGEITEGAPRRRTVSLSRAGAEEAQWESFLKNIKLEKLPIIVDEGNTIPVTLSKLQVERAIHSFKYIVAETEQPVLIGGTNAVRYIVEHDTQLKVRTMILMQDPYGNSEEDESSFSVFIKEMEARLGEQYCEPGSLSAHSAEIRRGVDGRCGLAVRLATDALSQHGGGRKLDWSLYKRYLDQLVLTTADDLAEERRVTKKPIVATVEEVTTKVTTKSRSVERKGRVGATRNTNSRNHPYD